MEGTIVLTDILLRAINWLFQLASLLIVARVFVSWVFPGQRPNPVFDFIYRTTEPILAPIRHHVTRLMGYQMPLDISPMVAILLLLATRYLLVRFIGFLI